MAEFISLTGPTGLQATFSDVGATLVAAHVPDRDGRLADVILGYDTPDEYLTGTSFFGATPGRYANRIAYGRFTARRILSKREVANSMRRW